MLKTILTCITGGLCIKTMPDPYDEEKSPISNAD